MILPRTIRGHAINLRGHLRLLGHIYKMAEAVAEGVREVTGCEVVIKRVPETLTMEVLGKMGALEAQKNIANIPLVTVDELAEADSHIFDSGKKCGHGERMPSDNKLG